MKPVCGAGAEAEAQSQPQPATVLATVSVSASVHCSAPALSQPQLQSPLELRHFLFAPEVINALFFLLSAFFWV